MDAGEYMKVWLLSDPVVQATADQSANGLTNDIIRFLSRPGEKIPQMNRISR